MSPLQAEIHAMEVRLLEEMGEALTRCRSHYDRDQCRRSYYRLMVSHQAMISEKHGVPYPMRERP